jgi:ATP adenylyltransferase
VVEHLFRPWRMRYVSAAAADSGGTGGSTAAEPADACFMCAAVASDDPAAHHLLARRDRTLVILNAYPYNSGHLMVAPLRHVGDLADLHPEEQAEAMALVVECVAALRTEYTPDGFNVGINLGRVAGAGLPGHVHIHVVPRWNGDTNFMPVLGDAKVLPEALEDTYRRLAPRLSSF